MRSSVCFWLAMAGALLVAGGAAASAARAQHGTAGYSVIPMDTRTSALVEVHVGEFELPGRRGGFQTLSPRVEYAPVEWFSLAVRPVVARIDYAGGQTVFGLSDTELVPKLRLWQSADRHTRLATGVSVELPTGDPGDGTGNGHVSLLPFVAFFSMPERWLMIHGMLGDRVVAAGDHPGEHAHHPEPHGSVLMPHGQHELAAHGGVCFMPGPFAISPGIGWMQVFDPESETLLIAQLELAYRPGRHPRFAAGIDLPLTSSQRHTWRTRIMAGWLW